MTKRFTTLESRRLRLAAMLSLPIALAGCQQKMADQPSYRPLAASNFFADGRSARPLEPGVVPSSNANASGILLLTGRIDEPASPAAPANSDVSPELKSLGGKPLENYSTQFPFPITQEALLRGQERFNIFCVVCHGPTGRGDGVVVERGYTRPPSYLTDNSRGLQRRGIGMSLGDVPVGYLFEVISKGYGAMADYSAQVPAPDRWLIVAYLRTLQLSQQMPLDELPQSQQDSARAALETTP